MNELERLSIINEYGLRKGEDDPSINTLIDATAALLHVPIAYVSVIDEYEQFFKAKYGLTLERTDRVDAFCNLVVE
ncbi:hypothetical protein [Vibrio tritonius]|uniref:hypothetical protein n=1 Tax=Vibrio tritonius TaxID=1435069 RepID=UPI00315D73A3